MSRPAMHACQIHVPVDEDVQLFCTYSIVEVLYSFTTVGPIIVEHLLTYRLVQLL